MRLVLRLRNLTESKFLFPVGARTLKALDKNTDLVEFYKRWVVENSPTVVQRPHLARLGEYLAAGWTLNLEEMK